MPVKSTSIRAAAYLGVVVLFELLPTTAAHELLLAVGDVTSHSARILYDALTPQWRGRALPVRVEGGPVSMPAAGLEVTPGPGPQVLLLQGLQPRTSYSVVFGQGLPMGDERVQFRTFVPPGEAAPLRLLTLSCDRWLEDQDDKGWEQLLGREGGRYDGIVHLGDQVYADRLFRGVSANITAEEALEKFRAAYRRQWGRPLMQRVLRYGAHWMLPDDHDVLNNLNAGHLQGCTSHIGPCSAPDPALKTMARAGVQAVLEYQLQLQGDVDPAHPRHAFSARVLGHVGLLFVDVRLDRTLTPMSGTHPPLLSPEQFEAVTAQLAAWATPEGPRDLLVFTAMPLLLHPPEMALIPYLWEGELYPGHPALMPDTLRLLDLLRRTNRVRLLVGGDIHFFGTSEACFRGDCLRQLLTSGISKGSTSLRSATIFPLHLILTNVARRQLGEWRWTFDEVFFGRNYGWIEVRPDTGLVVGGVFEPLGFPGGLVQGLVTHFWGIGGALVVVLLSLWKVAPWKRSGPS